jgi:hypothetical protein
MKMTTIWGRSTKTHEQHKLPFVLGRGSFFLVALLLVAPALVQASEETDVRGVVQQTFQQLQSQNFGAVYDALPAATRGRMSRSRFINAMQRAQGRYSLDRISIGSVRVAGDIAVADTELFGRITLPIPAEGKIVVQQYLVREDGKWRVATGDTATIQRFLKANPAFARKFPIRAPKIYLKQGNQWVEFKAPRN